jgi:hypothetical protein
MRKVIYSNPFFNLTDTQKGDVMELFTLEEVVNYPNISEKEIKVCKDLYEDDVVGFAKDYEFDEENPSFTQIFVEEITEISE